ITGEQSSASTLAGEDVGSGRQREYRQLRLSCCHHQRNCASRVEARSSLRRGRAKNSD
ncbi:hypothetical protein MKW92_053883, partial [Papaver armeniacum]